MSQPLSPDVWAMIRQEMAAAGYQDEGELLRDALAAFRLQRGGVVDEDAVAGIERGFADLDAGRVQDWTEFDADFRQRNGLPAK